MFKRVTRILASVVALSVLVMAGQAQAGNKLEVKGTDGSTTVFAVDDAGTTVSNKLGMGTSVPQAPIHLHTKTALGQATSAGTLLYNVSTGFAASTQDNTVQADFVVADGTNAAGMTGSIRGVRARGTLTSPTIPSVDDLVLTLAGGLWDGGKVYNAAQIAFKVDGAVSSSVAPQRIVFNIRNNGTGAYVERLTVKANGNVGISSPTPTALLDINSDTLRLRTAKTPGSAGAACNQGDISWDANFVYVCVADNSWKRASISTWP